MAALLGLLAFLFGWGMELELHVPFDDGHHHQLDCAHRNRPPASPLAHWQARAADNRDEICPACNFVNDAHRVPFTLERIERVASAPAPEPHKAPLSGPSFGHSTRGPPSA